MYLMSEAYRATRGIAWSWEGTSLLLVSHQWDPDRQGAEALAGRRLVSRLLDAGARVHVLASGKADDELDHPRYRVTVVPSPPFPSSGAARALAMLRSTVPESAGSWIDDAVAAGLEVARRVPDDTIIYGRASPGTSNAAAWRLARATGLPFVAHFSDRWPSFQLMTGRSRWASHKWPLFRLWRRRIFRDAGALTFTNPAEASAALAGERREYLAKAFVVPHLGTVRAPAAPPRYDTFHLVHTGNLYPPEHSAATLLQGIQRFLSRTPEARVVFRFTHAGWSHGDLPYWSERCGVSDVVDIRGRVSQAAVLDLLDAASLLIAIDYARPASTTLLSKLPDYIAAQRPILALTSPSSALHRLFHDDGAGLTARYDDPADVASRLDTVYAAWTRRRLQAFLPGMTAVRSFSVDRVLGELGAALATACERRNRIGSRVVAESVAVL